MRALFKALDEKQQLLSVLDKALAAEELTIFIGAESGISEPSCRSSPRPTASRRSVGALG